jgi:hypothetical protein
VCASGANGEPPAGANAGPATNLTNQVKAFFPGINDVPGAVHIIGPVEEINQCKNPFFIPDAAQHEWRKPKIYKF